MKSKKNLFRVRRIRSKWHQNSKHRSVFAALAAIAVLSTTLSYLDDPNVLAADVVTNPATAPATTFYSTTQTSPAAPSTSSTTPTAGPDTVTTVQPVFTGANIQGPIFNQKSGDTTAQQNPIQIYDHLNVWGGINSIGGIYNTNGDVKIQDTLTIDGKLKIGDAWLKDGGTAASGNTWIYLNDGSNTNENYTHGLAALNLLSNSNTYVENNLRVRGEIYNNSQQPVKFMNSMMLGAPDALAAPRIAAGGQVVKVEVGSYPDGTGIGIAGGLVVGGTLNIIPDAAAVFGLVGGGGDSVTTGVIKNTMGNTINIQENVMIDGKLRIGSDAWIKDGGSNSWIYLNDGSDVNSNYTHGLAALNLWAHDDADVRNDLRVENNIRVHGNIYNDSGNVTVNDNLSVLGNVYAVGIGRFYTRSDLFDPRNPDPAPQWIEKVVSCDPGSIRIACSGFQYGAFNKYKGSVPTANPRECKAVSVYDERYGGGDPIYVYAHCFSPGG